MELIFENVEERDAFFKDHCPGRFGGGEPIPPIGCDVGCKECWAHSGVKYSVKEKKQEYDNITITQRLYRIQDVYKSTKRLDPDFRNDDYEWIIGEALIKHLGDIGYEYRSVGDKYKSLAGICVTVDHDYPLRVILAKKNVEKYGPTPDHPVPIEEQMSNKDEVKASVCNAWFMMNPGDKLLKTEHGWRIEAKKEEPKQVYISTASHPDPLVERMLKNMLNTAYGKDGIRPFVVMPRHCGRTAAYSMIDEMYEYWKRDAENCMDAFRRSQEERRKLQIENVIFNKPATIVFWKDGTKTVVKCQDGDDFVEEKGLAMAICKKVFGNGSGYYEEFKKWLPEFDPMEAYREFVDAVERLTNSCIKINIPVPEEKKEEPERCCSNCRYARFKGTEYPCNKCIPPCINFKPKDAK